MPTGAVPGFGAKLAIDSSSGFVNIGELVDFSFQESAGEIAATSKDSGGAREFIPGQYEWTGQANGIHLDADVGQDDARTALTGRTTVQIRFRMEETVGKDEYTGTCLITGFGKNAPLDEAVSTDLTFRGSGLLTVAAQ